ncbi:mannosyltransferase [Dictyocaulus viviparus]|uniref:GPI mannosyltransferase 2 n=1 Tax=Dictyocaulus viviparus TaxID=29172 RepID=A0A0D8XHL5_DICVI|nr:mannosyltransferase [Dictyocaulus viviparus]
MENIEENLENVPSGCMKELKGFAVTRTERGDESLCAFSEEEAALSKKVEYLRGEFTVESNGKWSSHFFSIPSSILYEKIDDGDTTDFFDSSPSQIKDFLLWQVLGMRIFVFVLQFLFSSWDFSTDAFKGVPIEEGELSKLDHIIQRVFAGFKRWDAVHLLHIAQYEYVFESSLAFFPLYPMVIRVLSMAWAAPFVHLGFIHVSSALLISAVAINLGCFVIAAAVLYRIVQLISKSVKQSIIAVLLFSVNPASIFFSAAYTESLYCVLTFSGLLLLLENWPSFLIRYIGSLLCFGLAYATRSNGLVNLCYVEFFCLVEFLLSIDPENPRRRRVIFGSPISTIISKSIVLILRVTFAPLSVSLPIFIHGRRQQITFCSQSSANNVPMTLQRLAAEHRLVTVGRTDIINWCNVSSFIIPPFYTAVQSKYWHVSLLGYWRFRKIPCFLIAGPAFFIVAFGVYQTWRRLWLKKSLLHLLSEGGDHVPYTLHAVFLAFGALFVYNAEVLTRVLFSSSPFPYLVLARWISDSTPQVRLSDLFVPQPFPFFTYFCRRGLTEFLLYLYLMSYLIFGTTMHAMWLPFT